MTTILPMISLKKVLRTKLTILPMYQICLPNVNTIHDLRLTSLYLQSSEDCHFGVENISLVRMLNNPQYLYNVLLFISHEQLYFQRGETKLFQPSEHNINDNSIINAFKMMPED